LDGVAFGHYKLTFVERIAPRKRAFGPGRVFIEDLNRHDISVLVDSEKAEPAMDDGRYHVFGIPGWAGFNLPTRRTSIHGGGESLPAPEARQDARGRVRYEQDVALVNYQPLTPIAGAIRIHNAPLLKLMDFLEPRLRCQQLVILTISG